MIKLFKSCVTFVIIFSLTGCASIIKGNHQYVDFDTIPSGATVIAKYPNSEPQTFKTPANIRLATGKEPYSIEISKAGYEPLSILMDSSLSCWFWVNIITIGFFGVGIIGMIMDTGSSSAYTFRKTSYKYTLEPISPTEQVNTKK